MWFKNLQIYRLPAPWAITPEQIEEALAPLKFVECSSQDMSTQGWVAPRGNDKLVYTVGKQMLLQMQYEKKLLPASVINQVAKARAIELEEKQGFKPGKKQMRELKEDITEELLPRAFSIKSSTRVWIDPVNGWLAVDAAAASKADDILKSLLKGIDKMPVTNLNVATSPGSAMTTWLAEDDAPGGFTVDQDTELSASGESRAKVRFVNHTLEPEDVRRHIAGGKQCTRLAMTWADRVSFVLTEGMAVKSVKALDVLKENEAQSFDDDERFDADFTLMTGELAKLIADLVLALGGEHKD
ncbi:recombination-associated protein RdgC [Massilia sp. W12]|uniref:recombination-associated protein RdgC n=1 Tax=Massilia sp. W12 TaxID=3126507 RepID=UPI0030D31461